MCLSLIRISLIIFIKMLNLSTIRSIIVLGFISALSRLTSPKDVLCNSSLGTTLTCLKRRHSQKPLFNSFHPKNFRLYI